MTMFNYLKQPKYHINRSESSLIFYDNNILYSHHMYN